MRLIEIALAMGALAVAGPGLSSGSRLLNRNDAVPVYKDSSYCIDDRVEDLLRRMTLEEKAGQMFQAQLYQGANGTLDTGDVESGRNSTENMLGDKLMTHFNLVGNVLDAKLTAQFTNRVQKRAAETRLGIPVTLSSDPRHHFTDNIGTGFMAGVFSQWPETPGLAALRDVDVVRTFAEIAREEYTAVGIRAALHPQVDISTEPRWSRISGTWGENADLTSKLIVAYIKGFQGETLGKNSVTTVTKHFPGNGPAEDGEDSHFPYGKNVTYPGHNMEYHLKPFRAAIAAGARQIMPYYGRPIGTKYEAVGGSYNKGLITDLLRGELGFEGIVVTDWGLVTDFEALGQEMPAMAWGVEDLSEIERMAKILDAGCDQFGGEQRPEMIIQLVEEGYVTEDRIDISVRRLLREKFILGLFDAPYVDPDAAAITVGNPYFTRAGNDAQRRSYTLLSNKDEILPLASTANVKYYIEGFNATFMEARGLTVVDTPGEADLALIRLAAPYETRPGGFAQNFHAGNIEFNSTQKAQQAAVYSAVPTIVDLKFDRPVAIPEVVEQAAAVLGSFGSSPEAFLDVVFGVSQPEGKLPYDLPRSMHSVEVAKEDVPFDSKHPLFRFGFGLRYSGLQCSVRSSAL
ncbi:glycoside hydrolase superfamily [Aspergillus californicus]